MDTTTAPVKRLYVSEENINTGIPEDLEACPVALALLDAGYARPNVDEDNLFAYLGGVKQCFTCPKELRRFINDFDAGEVRVQPEAFELPFTSWQ